MRFQLSVLAAAVCGLATGAAAQDRNWYVEAGAAQVLEDDFDTTGVNVRLGRQWRAPRTLVGVVDRIAVEGDIFYGLSGDEQETSFGTVDAEVQYIASGSVRAVNALTNRIDAFARIGLSYASAEVDLNSQFSLFDDSDTDTDLLVGAGGAFRFLRNTSVRGDYTLQNDFEVVSVTLSHNF